MRHLQKLSHKTKNIRYCLNNGRRRQDDTIAGNILEMYQMSLD